LLLLFGLSELIFGSSKSLGCLLHIIIIRIVLKGGIGLVENALGSFNCSLIFHNNLLSSLKLNTSSIDCLINLGLLNIGILLGLLGSSELSLRPSEPFSSSINFILDGICLGLSTVQLNLSLFDKCAILIEFSFLLINLSLTVSD
jgi:hypothetical protein